MGNTAHSASAREIFGRNVKSLRLRRDWTQEELALGTGLSRTYISEVERAARNVSIDNMEMIGAAFGVPLRVLLDERLFDEQAFDSLVSDQPTTAKASRSGTPNTRKS